MTTQPDSPRERSCFRGLREALADHFSDDHIRAGYEAEEALIREVLRTQPDASVTQDLLAGFLNGYLLGVAEFGSEDLVSQRNDAMFSVIGGIYLVGGDAPLSCLPECLDSLRTGFFGRLGRTLLDDLLPQPDDVERRYSAAEDAILRIFGTTPDVPVNAESLAGFVLGVMYSHRYVPADGDALTAIMEAAYLLADRSDLAPDPGPRSSPVQRVRLRPVTACLPPWLPGPAETTHAARAFWSFILGQRRARPGGGRWLCGTCGSGARAGIRPGCRRTRGRSS